jgi:hypothetical protein
MVLEERGWLSFLDGGSAGREGGTGLRESGLKHWAPKQQPPAVLFCLLANEARSKRRMQGARGEGVHAHLDIEVPTLLTAARLVMCRKYYGRYVVVHCG